MLAVRILPKEYDVAPCSSETNVRLLYRLWVQGFTSPKIEYDSGRSERVHRGLVAAMKSKALQIASLVPANCYGAHAVGLPWWR